jgi:osmotically-inducible protein OsmY
MTRPIDEEVNWLLRLDECVRLVYTGRRKMTIRMTSLGLPAALLAGLLFGGCQNTARGFEQDTENNTAKAKAASRDAAPVVEHAAEVTKQAAADAADAIRDAAKNASAGVEQKSKDEANTTASAMDSTALSMKIKSALIADKSVHASDVDVDVSGSTRTVTLKGIVPTGAQKAEAERVARNKAPGYEIVNMLAVR